MNHRYIIFMLAILCTSCDAASNSTGTDRPLVIGTLIAFPPIGAPGSQVLLVATINNADEKSLSFTWASDAEDEIHLKPSSSRTAFFSGASPGVHRIRLIVTDGDRTAEGDVTFMVSLTGSIAGDEDEDKDDLYDGWEMAYFGSTASQDGDDDPDGDGEINKDEQEKGTDPTVSK
jgi:hypothetical protein